MKLAFGISIAVLGGLLLCLMLVREPARWPAPEPTPYQGEATEPGKEGHSAVALARLIREPQNTWSNLAFVVAGGILLGCCRTRIARAVGIPLIGVGVGSFLYHASASAQLRHLDVGAMYWLFLMVGAHGCSVVLVKSRPRIERNPTAIAIIALVAAVLLTAFRNVKIAGFKPLSLTFATAITATVLIVALAEIARRRRAVSAALRLIGIVAVFGVAVFFQLSDRPGQMLYRPGAMVPAHALWHVLSAAALLGAVVMLDSYAAAQVSDPSNCHDTPATAMAAHASDGR